MSYRRANAGPPSSKLRTVRRLERLERLEASVSSPSFERLGQSANSPPSSFERSFQRVEGGGGGETGGTTQRRSPSSTRRAIDHKTLMKTLPLESGGYPASLRSSPSRQAFGQALRRSATQPSSLRPLGRTAAGSSVRSALAIETMHAIHQLGDAAARAEARCSPLRCGAVREYTTREQWRDAFGDILRRSGSLPNSPARHPINGLHHGDSGSDSGSYNACHDTYYSGSSYLNYDLGTSTTTRQLSSRLLPGYDEPTTLGQLQQHEYQPSAAHGVDRHLEHHGLRELTAGNHPASDFGAASTRLADEIIHLPRREVDYTPLYNDARSFARELRAFMKA